MTATPPVISLLHSILPSPVNQEGRAHRCHYSDPRFHLAPLGKLPHKRCHLTLTLNILNCKDVRLGMPNAVS